MFNSSRPCSQGINHHIPALSFQQSKVDVTAPPSPPLLSDDVILPLHGSLLCRLYFGAVRRRGGAVLGWKGGASLSRNCAEPREKCTRERKPKLKRKNVR